MSPITGYRSRLYRSFVSQKSRTQFVVAVLLLTIGGLSSTIFRSAAQEVKDPDQKGRDKILNFDIRANGGEELARTIQKYSGGRDNFSAEIMTMARQRAEAINGSLAQMRKRDPSTEVTLSPLTGAVEVLRSSKTLTGPSFGQDAKNIGLAFLSANKEFYGIDDDDIANLHYNGESINEFSGLRLAIFEQVVHGRLVFQGDCKLSLDRDGRIIQSLSNLAPYASRRALTRERLISPEEALVHTMKSVGVLLDTGTMAVVKESEGLDTEITVADKRIAGKVTSKIVYFPVAPGLIIPAWSLTIFGDKADWYALVDASDGTLLWRKNIRSDVSTHQARFRVYVQADGSTPADSPSPLSPSTLVPGFQPAGIAPSIVSMLTVQNIVASPNGWIDDCPGGVCTANETQTLGNNALVCVDRTSGASNVCDTVAPSNLDGNGRPTGNPDASARNRDFLGTAPRDFETTFLPAPQGGNPEAGQTSTAGGAAGTTFLRASATQMFYATNWYHDKLYAFGFTPASRNFQVNNFGGGGTGNDRVLVDVQDGQSVNNANFSTPPDGTSGRAQMFNFTGPTIDRDGGLDSEILIHELTHGTSNRLVGNGSGLVWQVGGGMGEGWSDFYALSLLNNTNADNPNLGYASGAYATYKLAGLAYTDNYTYGIRRFPYHTVNTVNPMTWADVDDVTNNLSGGIAPSSLTFNNNGAMEVHNSAEIWALTLWEVRSRIIADPAGANGDVPTGNNTTLSIVTDAMRLFTPNNPSFVQGRDALVDADCAANAACPNEVSIWGGFADRGLGYGAIAPLGYMFAPVSPHMGVGESFASPNLDINTVTINDTGGNNSGGIDPDETVRLVINVKNPWRGAARSVASATATLTTSTPGASVLQGSTTYPAIAAAGNANPSGPFLVLKAPAGSACGSSIDLTLTLTSTLGVVSQNFKLRLGVAGGTLAPVTYTKDTTPDLPIPDNAPRGVGDTLIISDDYEIADLNFRMDSLIHTWSGDIVAMLKAPNGYGTSLISWTGRSASGTANSGDNFINTVIDDTAAAPNDLLNTTAAAAPFTRSWLPAFNAPSWTLIGLPSVDPVGQLSRLNGSSTLGTWNLRVSDQVGGDVGTLNQWSLIVTPRAFTCTPFVPTAAHVSISGRVLDSNLQGVFKARVTVLGQNGMTQNTLTNAFGFFRIEDLAAGQSYLIEVSSKRFIYAPRVVNAVEDVTDVDFTPIP